MFQDSKAEGSMAGNRLCRAEDNCSRIREIRRALGVQNRELAANMGVSPARISVLERDERRGAVTLKMMQKAAEALGCDFVYTLQPRNRPQPELPTDPQQSKPRIQLDSSLLRGDTEQQRLMLRREYARRLGACPTQD